MPVFWFALLVLEDIPIAESIYIFIIIHNIQYVNIKPNPKFQQTERRVHIVTNIPQIIETSGDQWPSS